MEKLLNVLFLSLIVNFVFAQTTIIPLNSGWSFNQNGHTEMMPASVPGCVQSDLLALNKIPDPYIGLNEEKIKWIEGEDWKYSRVVQVSTDLLRNDKIHLVFEGLDTYAEVFINGRSVLNADNMFRKWVIDAKPFLKTGRNEIQVLFKSITKQAEPMAKASHIKYPADNEKGDVKISPFVRKGQFQFGWDFAPRILTSGIWKPVYLEAWGVARIEGVQVQLQKLEKKSADYSAIAEVNILKEGNYAYMVTDKKSGKILSSVISWLKSGSQDLALAFSIDNPELWWPNGLGSPHLYDLEFSLKSKGKSISTKEVKLGVRQIEVVNKPDSLGESFFVKINGIPVFMKGTNFVPVSSLVNRSNGQKLEQLFASMKDSHFNMVRVWGGGFYGDNDFYDLADRNGILVWQDFMFACTMYPSDRAFLANIEQEAIDNIKRVRNHPSLALWCGNNEIAVGWKNWGWQKSYGYSREDSLELINGYHKLFRELLPGLVQRYDKNRFYFHSSPISNWGKAEDFKYGDNHYWGVYHGEQPFSAYETHIPRFNSEYGFQSFPSWQSLQKISGETQPSLKGEVLSLRQKSYKGNKLLQKYMDWYYAKPQNDEEFVYLSQLQQAEGMKTAIEANRRAMPYNMGSLFWQLNDTWPAISWSAIEYGGNWKAAQYFIKKAFEPVILSVKEEGDNLLVYVVSDRLISLDAGLNINTRAMNKSAQSNKNYTLKQIKANSATVQKIPVADLKIGDKRTDFIDLELKQGKDIIARQIHYFRAIKDLDLPGARIDFRLVPKGELTEVLLKSDRLAKNVYLSLTGSTDCHFSDNYFDMLPGQEYKIILKTGLKAPFIKNQLKIMQVKNQR